MSTVSGSAFLVWSILSVVFLIFLTHHLWCYDRFRCLKWNSGRQPGAFRRFMTYSYVASVPLMSIFSVAMAYIKFKQGWLSLSDVEVIPMPVNLYPSHYKHWLLVLYFVFSVAWSLELITHLEELTFWLFMLSGKGQWFASCEYRLWYLGSIVSVLGLPSTVLVTRYNIQTCDAFLILVGAASSTLNTLLFFYVLFRFPGFVQRVKSEGADPNVVIQLYTFYRLNCTRVIFRLLFTVPLLVLATDAVITGNHPVNSNLFCADLLFMLGGFGCFFSSGITLLIFFPLSVAIEAGCGTKPGIPPQTAFGSNVTSPKSTTMDVSQVHVQHSPSRISETGLETSASRVRQTRNFRSLDLEVGRARSDVPPYRQFEAVPSPHILERSISMNAQQLRRSSSLHPYMATFTSPIDLIDISPPPDDWPRVI